MTHALIAHSYSHSQQSRLNRRLFAEEYPHSLGQSSVLSHFRLCETIRVSSIVYARCIN